MVATQTCPNREFGGGKFRIATVPPQSLQLLEKNARFMRNETFRRLVENVKRDGQLSSVPFCVRLKDGRYRVLSGNHRVMAAREAGLSEISIMFTEEALSDQEQIAIQLSHNALVGEDDPIILRELYQAIESLDLKDYSGLDDKLLGSLGKVDMAGFSEARLDYAALTFLFLPEEKERLLETLRAARQTLANDVILARRLEYDRLLDAQVLVQAAYKVHNGATSIMLLLDVFERHLEDLKEGWLDAETGEAKHNEWVPLASIIGTDRVPAKAAAIIDRAVQKLLSSGDVTAKNKWQALEYLAAEYLGGV